MKAYINGKLRDPLGSAPNVHSLRFCFEILRDIILDDRAQIGLLFLSVSQTCAHTRTNTDK
jgi:hypothetical protein